MLKAKPQKSFFLKNIFQCIFFGFFFSFEWEIFFFFRIFSLILEFFNYFLFSLSPRKLSLNKENDHLMLFFHENKEMNNLLIFFTYFFFLFTWIIFFFLRIFPKFNALKASPMLKFHANYNLKLKNNIRNLFFLIFGENYLEFFLLKKWISNLMNIFSH